MTNKRVLFVINTLGKAGAEIAFVELLNRLKGYKGLQIDVYVMCAQGEVALPENVNLLNRKFSSISVLTKEGKRQLIYGTIKSCLNHFSLLKNFFYLMHNLLRMLAKGRIQLDKLLWRIISDGADFFDTEYDLAVSFIEGASAYYVADHVRAKKKAAFIHIDYNLAGYTTALDKSCYQKFDKIFTVSNEVRDSFILAYPSCEPKTFVFHNILDSEKIIRLSKQPGGFEDDFDGMRILTVGRLVYQKGYDMAIKAMKLLCEVNQPLRWYILGEGEKRAELEALIKDNDLQDAFILLGAKENPYPYIAQADIYAHFSRFEGKSIAISEAQILGKPIAASDCSGNREQILNEIDGILCEFEPTAMRDAILELAEDEEKRERFGRLSMGKQTQYLDDINMLLDLL